MPNIPQYNSGLATEGLRPSDLGADAWAQEGRRVGQFYHQIGEEAKSTIDDLQAHDDLQTSIAMTDKSNQVDAQLAQEYATQRANPNFNLEDWQAHVAEAYGSIGQTEEKGFLGGILGQSDTIRAHAANLRSQGITYWTKQAINDQMTIDGDKAVQAGLDTVESARKTVYDDPSQLGAQLPLVTAKLASLYSSARVPPNVLAAEADKVKFGLAQATLDGFLNQLHTSAQTPQQIAALRAQVNDPTTAIYQTATQEQRSAFNDKIDSIKNTQGVAQSDIFKSRLPDLLDQVKQTGDTSQIDAGIAAFRAKTPDTQIADRQEMLDKRNGAVAYFKVSQDAGLVPQSQEGAYTAQRKAEFGAASPEQITAAKTANDAAVTFFKDRDKAFANGTQAQFLIQHNDTLSAYYQQYQANPNAQTFAKYAAYSAALQGHINPSAPPNLVDGNVKQEAQAAIRDIQSKQGPGAAIGAVQQMAQKYGAYWPTMAIQLRKDKVLPAVVGVAAELAGDPRTQALSEMLMETAAMSKADLAAKNNITEEKAIRVANTQLAPLFKTMANIPGGGNQIIADYREALASGLQYTNGITSTALANQMLLNRYQFPLPTLRLQARLGLDPARIGDGAKAVQGDIGNHNLVLPPAFGSMGVSPNRYAAQIKSSGQWFANENGTGAILYDEDMHPVQERIGAPHEPTFDLTKEPGMVAPGNMAGANVWHRPVLHNPDGSYSTTSSASANFEGKEVLFPTVVNGKRLTTAQAIQHYKQTGENLGSFDNVAHANAFAIALHNAQAQMYDKHGNALGGSTRDVELTWDELGKVADKQPLRATVKAAAGLLDKVTGGP